VNFLPGTIPAKSGIIMEIIVGIIFIMVPCPRESRVHKKQQHRTCRSIAYSPNGNQLAAGGGD